MATINEIHKRVFDVLMEHHYREKESGREFYFLTEELDDYKAYMSFTDLYEEQKLEREQKIIIVNLFAENKAQCLLQLIIHSENLFVCGKKGANSYDEYRAIFDKVYSPHTPERFIFFKPWNIYALKLDKENSLVEILQLFLDKDWSRVVKLSSIPKKWLIDKETFETYLEESPYYILLTRPTINDIALKALEVTNFKGIKHILIENLPRNTRWFFLTGENGFGKTSLLQAIAAGLYGRYDSIGNELIPIESEISISYFTLNSTISGHLQSYSISRTINYSNTNIDSRGSMLNSNLATYGSSRLQISGNTTKEEVEKQSPPTYSLFNTDGVLLDIEQRLKDTKAYFPDEFNQIVDIFQKLMPNLAKIEVETFNKSVQVKYFEKDDEGNLVNEGVTFTQLAAGYRNIIAMIGDMIYRLSTKQDVAKLSELEGIVIIDELELHLHPNYQKLFVQKLTELFPKIQFIASTHSPIPLLGAPPETVILHVTRSREKGIEVEKLDVDFSVLTPNAILTSPIFGFQELIPESKPDDMMIRSEQTYQEVLLNDQLDKQIDKYLTEENKNELLSLLKK